MSQTSAMPYTGGLAESASSSLREDDLRTLAGFAQSLNTSRATG
ncbi:hypothetical protein [Streptomyces sp. YS-3]